MARLAIWVLMVATAALVANADERDECVKEVENYLKQGMVMPGIDEPVKTLIEASRHYYQDSIELIENDLPSDDYRARLAQLGTQVGCEEIICYINDIVTKVPCYQEFERDKDDVLLEVVRKNLAAKEFFEAYYACKTAGLVPRYPAGLEKPDDRREPTN